MSRGAASRVVPAGALRVVKSKSCRTAIMFGDPLHEGQCTELLRCVVSLWLGKGQGQHWLVLPWLIHALASVGSHLRSVLTSAHHGVENRTKSLNRL